MEQRVEMHLECLRSHVAHAGGGAVAFTAGETIHTENSYKFTQSALLALLTQSGFSLNSLHHDADHRFAVVLAEVV
jgi:uncharacterized SAM-dependent methyltransferase